MLGLDEWLTLNDCLFPSHAASFRGSKRLQVDQVYVLVLSFRADKLGEAVCAFANDLPDHRQPGYLLLGVRDDGTVDPASITDADLQNIGDIRLQGNVLHQPMLVVSTVFSLPEGDVVVVEVHPADYPPVRYKGACYIRIGPRKGIASLQEERVLMEKRARHARSFDQRVCRGSSTVDLSTDVFKLSYLPEAYDAATLEANNRTTEEQLASLGFFSLEENLPTNAGLLLFGHNSRFFYPGADVQYVKFGGDEMTTPVLAEKEFSGALVTVIDGLQEFIKGVVLESRPVAGTDFRERQLSNYPLWALRELLMNAIMHRDYESNAPVYIYHFIDRIIIVNPGGLYGDARPENFPNTSDYRNPLIAQAIKNLGYVNRFNPGIATARRSLADNGNPPPEFDLSLQTKFSVTIPVNKEWHA